MTPLLHRVARQLTLPVKRRTIDDRSGLLRRLDDVHPFECTAIMPFVGDLAARLWDAPDRGAVLAFLPAPRTWIEWQWRPGVQVGVMLDSGPEPDPDFATVTFVGGGDIDQRIVADLSPGALPLRSMLDLVPARHVSNGLLPEDVFSPCRIYALLACINTPRVINKAVHMPHRGLQRDLARAQRAVGSFPLRAWTELKLEVRAPRDDAGEPSEDIWLTGRKALHFVRAHLRISHGRLDLVRAYWRGDAALGIKQTKYAVIPPRDGAPAHVTIPGA